MLTLHISVYIFVPISEISHTMNGLLLLVLFGVVTLVTVAAAKKSPVQPKAKVKDEPEVTEESEAIKRMKELKEQGFEGILN